MSNYRSLANAILAVAFLLTAVHASAENSASEGKHLFILSGQSNMRNPLPTAFKAAVGKVFGEEKVIVVTVAHPSQPIRRWYKKWHLPEGQTEEPPKNGKEPIPNGDIYDQLMASVQKAITGKTITTVTYIWMQGEADAQSGWGEVYEESFYGVLDQIKNDLDVKQVNYVLGRINDYWTNSRGLVNGDMMRELQQKIGEAHEYGDWVDTDDLNTGVNPWGGYSFCDGHFPPPAYSVLGERFARKACLIIDPDLKFADDVFSSKHFDSPDDIASHGGIACAVSGSKPTKGALAILTDGKFGKPDPDDAAWLAFTAADDDTTELMLDLGELRTIDQLGISLLYHPEAGAPFPKGMTMETSSDGKVWQSLNSRNFSFINGRPKGNTAEENPIPQSMIALVPGPTNRGVPIETRYFRIRIQAPIVFVDEIIVEPVAAK